MEIDEEHVNTLLSMGFPSDIEVRKALRFAKNDLNDAVAYLTNDHSTSSYDTLDDIEMKDLHPRSSQAPVYGPSPPPSYDECVIPERTDGQSENGSGGEGMIEELNPLEFPVTNLYELEGRVFAEQWSIPYKKEESLGKCLLAATRLAEANMAENDEHCRRFLERCMPESFQKLMTYSAVHRWNVEIQEGIFNMLQLFIDLVATRLQYLPVPIGLLDVLQTALNKDTEYHFKNRSRKDRTYWDDKLEGGQLFTTNTGYKSAQDTYGWLSHLINRFAMKKGLEHVKNLLENEEMDAPSMAALLRPFGTCAEFLNPGSVSEILAPGMERSIKYVQNLEEKDFKEKKVGYVSDLLASMKLLCIQMWPQHTDSLDDLRLDIALRMLKSPHFNAKMNSLKEVSKLIEEAASSKVPKTAIPSRKISDWLVEHKVLSIALEGNIDQTQYCDKIKGIVDYIGAELSQDELTMIWKMQLRQTNNVTDNIHSIIAAAAVKFDHNLLDHLFCLIHMKWQEDNDKMREKLLSLIGKIGRDARDVKSTTRVLELLWDLSHLRAMSTHLIEQALEEHLAILSDSFSVKEQEKRKYVVKCVEDIKKGACVLPALKQLLHICKNILKQSIQKSDKGILHELNKNHDVIKLVTNSLVKCHKLAITSAGDGQLSQHTIVDGRYMHSEYVTNHLSFLQYMLQEGALYLPWSRARDIWGTLIGSSDACDWDRETCYDWFSHGLTDLEMETQSQLFQKELLKLDPAKLSEKGFTCFKSFFENVNKFEHRLKSDGNKLVVEKSELLGLDYIWEICLNTPDESIASQAISLLLSVLYTHLTARLKKDPVVLHKKFITDCKSRLEAAMIGIGGTVIAQSISWATKTLTAAIVPEVANVPLPSRNKKLMNIERLMWIAEEYVLNVEETHHTARTILPHGASFHGHQMNLTVTSESPKQEFLLVCHSNETLGSIRSKISSKLRQTPENIQVVAQDKMLGISDDQKLLNQLDIEDNQVIQVRPTTSSALQSSQVKEIQENLRIDEPPATPTSKQTFDLEQEKMLPGVVMAMGGQVFEMLYQLADLEEPRITSRVRKLLMLIPTDPAISESLDSISNKMSKQMGSGDDISPRASPRKTTATVTPVSSPRLPPKEVLKVLFDSGAQDMSAFRVLYNLEVLSSKLMPTTCDIGTRLSAQQFCEDFLNCDGLQMVVNVLQPESLAPDLNYTTRQGCYSICLQLARFLLCGQTVTGEAVSSEGVASLPSEAGDMPKVTLSATPPTSLTSPLTINVERAVTAAGHAVQTMGVHVFTETVSCFMRVTWAAAAGRLHLLSSPQPIIENSNMYGCGCRSRQSSTGSTASTGSDSDCQTLHAGVCVRQTFISSKDCNIAKEALEILVACLQLRSELLASFYTLPCVSDFIIDILVGCSQSDIRNAALDQFYLLSQTQLSIIEGSTINSSVGHQTPHQFILKVLLKAYLPFWVSSASTRGASQRLLMQCSQYFDLRCRLLENLTVEDQKKLSLDVPTMLEDEINWLGNFVPSTNLDLSDTDNSLLAGHLKLIKTLFTCEGIDKEEFGRGLVYDLLNDFLFPASKVMMDSMDDSNLKGDLTEANPKCSNSESRVAAYQLLAELATDSLPILSDICKQLIQMHHLPQPDCANEWEYLPPVDGRARCGYVGLKNGGATCYMNSVIQQLYMAPGIPESVLGIDDDNIEEESVFYQIQQVFGHLMESKLQYHEPEKFWKVFQLWGQSINIREQQDAFDFFQALVDQVDEHMKKSGKEELFKARFEGIFSDQKICKDCPHRYEREESFFALNLTVKNATLQDSLDQFVHGELLEGDNAYFCEKCGEKRNTIKRMCIKTLPPLLCIQLKRFGYDWEANRALKFDDYFKFPWVLDMEPYTAEGMARREEATENAESSSESESGDTTSSLDERMPEIVESSHVESKQINYELVGVVVHSGQANAGHYYSFIKDRRGTVMDNPNKGKWYKFNDTVVEECEMTDETLEAECFGGTYKAKVYESSSSYPDDRVRYWNGYMLFYEKVQEPKNPSSAKKTKIIKRVVPDLGKGRLDSDSLMELTELVHKGERRGIFTEQMPASIHQVIQGENLTFVKNRDVYNVEYFRFVKNLVDLYSKSRNKKDFTAISVQSLQLGMKYLFNTFFRTKKRTKTDLYEWAETIECKLQGCKEACIWMVEYMSGVEGSSYIKPFLLECPNREVRFTFARILDALMSSYFKHGGIQTQKNFDEILEHLLQMLNKDVIDHCKYCTQYFQVLFHYVQMGTKACTHMFLRRGFPRLVTFLLGQSQQHLEDQESSTRRWSSIQSREFGNLHSTLAILILNCDVSHYRTEDIGDYKPYKPQSGVHPSKLLKMSPEMEKYVFGAESVRYLREVVQAVREISNMSHHVSDMIVYCSFCNKTFSDTVLKQLMLQYTNGPSNELKMIFSLLMELLSLEDPVQLARLELIIEGTIDDSGTQYEGLIGVIRQNHLLDSRRSYSCIKFLVSLANRCSAAKNYLMQIPPKWQWAVNWLKKKMSEYYWNTPTSSTVSNEDSNRKSFQRTISAQSTLDDANALLMELETHEGTGSALDMDTNGNKSDMETETSGRTTTAPTDTQTDTSGKSTAPTDAQTDTSVKMTAPTDTQTDTYMSTEEEDKKPNS